MLARLVGHARHNAVAYLALFVALGGTSAYAANEWNGSNIQDETLTGADIKGKNRRRPSRRQRDDRERRRRRTAGGRRGGPALVDGSLTGWDVADGSLQGRDIVRVHPRARCRRPRRPTAHPPAVRPAATSRLLSRAPSQSAGSLARGRNHRRAAVRVLQRRPRHGLAELRGGPQHGRVLQGPPRSGPPQGPGSTHRREGLRWGDLRVLPACRLPAGGRSVFASMRNGALARINVDPDGGVMLDYSVGPSCSSAGDWLSLEKITFRAV